MGLGGLWLACPKPTVQPVPDYVPPPDAWSRLPEPRASATLLSAWTALQQGNYARVRRAIRTLRTQYPDWDVPDAMTGWSMLMQHQSEQAARHFQTALQKNPQNLGALLGMMMVYEMRQDWVAAVEYGDLIQSYAPEWFRRDRAAQSPEIAALQEHVAWIRMQALEQMIRRARRYRHQGDAQRAAYWYRQAIARSPTHIDLLLEFADWLVSLDRTKDAIAYYQMAYNHHPESVRVAERLARALVDTAQWTQALPLLERLRTMQPNRQEWRDLVTRARLEMQKSAVATEYTRIRETPYITRGQVAAILCLEIPAIAEMEPPGPPVIILDTQQHWARTYIQKVVRIGFMRVYENHTFQPDRPVSRGEFAGILYRVLRHFGADAMVRVPEDFHIADVSPVHRYYRQIRIVVALGLLRLRPGQRFGAGERVSGADALHAVQALRNLLGR